MILSSVPGLQSDRYRGTSSLPPDRIDEDEFQKWLSRRDSARQQIRRLSRREVQVVNLVSHGFSNKGIAEELQISVKTIEKHRANAARKLGANSTAELVRISVLADTECMVQTLPEREEFSAAATSLSSVN